MSFDPVLIQDLRDAKKQGSRLPDWLKWKAPTAFAVERPQ
jgi:hypothetical protein